MARVKSESQVVQISESRCDSSQQVWVFRPGYSIYRQIDALFSLQPFWKMWPEQRMFSEQCKRLTIFFGTSQLSQMTRRVVDPRNPYLTSNFVHALSTAPACPQYIIADKWCNFSGLFLMCLLSKVQVVVRVTLQTERLKRKPHLFV